MSVVVLQYQYQVLTSSLIQVTTNLSDDSETITLDDAIGGDGFWGR